MNRMEQLAWGITLLPEAKHEVEWVISHYTGVSKQQMLLDASRPLSAREEEVIQVALRRRQAGEPLQYILGEQPFMDFTLTVTPAVLIPRWDSEVVVEKALDLLPKDQDLLVCDLGTGSGALALAIKYYRPQATVLATDISKKALTVAQANSQHLNLPVAFYQGDLLAPLPITQGFDLFISNPPYIPVGKLAQLPQDVLQEPLLALDGGEDGLVYYRRLAAEAPPYLKAGGYLLVEIGHDQGQAVTALWQQAGLIAIELGYDYGNNQRFVVGKKQ